MEKKNKTQERPSCSECGSKLIYIRLKENERVCRSCGFVEKIKFSKKRRKK